MPNMMNDKFFWAKFQEILLNYNCIFVPKHKYSKGNSRVAIVLTKMDPSIQIQPEIVKKIIQNYERFVNHPSFSDLDINMSVQFLSNPHVISIIEKGEMNNLYDIDKLWKDINLSLIQRVQKMGPKQLCITAKKVADSERGSLTFWEEVNQRCDQL